MEKKQCLPSKNIDIAKQCRRAGGGGKEGLYRQHPTIQRPKQQKTF